MVAQRRREIRPLNFWHLLAECHSGKLFFELALPTEVFRGHELLSDSEEPLLFLFVRMYATFDQVNQNAVGAATLGYGQPADAARDANGQRYALTYSSVGCGHDFIIHHNAPQYFASATTAVGVYPARRQPRPQRRDSIVQNLIPGDTLL